MNASLAGFI